MREVARMEDVVILSRVRLSRNFADLPFSPRLEQGHMETILDRAQTALAGENYQLYRLSELSEGARKRLLERRLISYDLIRFADRAFALISGDESLTVMGGESDHLRIQGQYPGLALDRAAQRAFAADDLLTAQATIAFDETWGYLTACPTDAGTGLRATVILHLPALREAGQIGAMQQALSKLGLHIRGLYGDNAEASGDLFQLSNQATLGRTEEDFIQSVVAAAKQVGEHERALRQQLQERDREGMADRLMRSVGILLSARLLSEQEMMQRLSDLRLASVLELMAVEPAAVDALSMSLGSGSLDVLAGRELSAREQERLRARQIRERMDKMGIITQDLL